MNISSSGKVLASETLTARSGGRSSTYNVLLLLVQSLVYFPFRFILIREIRIESESMQFSPSGTSLVASASALVPRNFHGLRYAWPLLFVILIALECIPFWAFQYFPSQDGPSHLYNASVLANYEKQVAYRDYYSVRVPLAGNIMTQAVVVALLKTGISPEIAQKLLLTAYAALFPLCLWYLLAKISSHAKVFSLFAILFIPNFFLHKGFWNFCIGVPLALLASAYYVRYRERWSYQSIILFAILGAILYLTHIVAWGVFAIVVIAYEVVARLSLLKGNNDRFAASAPTLDISKRQILALCSLFPPAFLTLAYSVATRAESRTGMAMPESLLHKLRILCSLSFLHTLSPSDIVTARLIALLVGLMFVVALIYRLRRFHLKPTDAFIGVSAACALLAIFGPDAVGDGSYIHLRMSFFALILLIVWLAAQEWSAWTMNGLCLAVILIAITSLLARLPEYRQWSEVLRSFATVGQRIRPDATVLTIKTERGRGSINPLLHAVGLFTPRPFIDLCNYEADTDQFPLRFRPNRSPDGPLAKPAELEQVPPVFNIPRYETQTLGCVDYVLVYALPKFADGSGGGADRYQAKLQGYTLIFASDAPLKERLYMRRKSCGR